MKLGGDCIFPCEGWISEYQGTACPWGQSGLAVELPYQWIKPEEMSVLGLVSGDFNFSATYLMVPSCGILAILLLLYSPQL